MVIFYIFILIVPMFIFHIYTIAITVKVRDEIFDKFPDQANRHLGKKKRFWRINPEQSLFFLWYDEIKILTKNNGELERKRKKAVWFNLLDIFGIIPYMVIVTLLIYYWG
jgi:hypothetical protein